MTRERDPKLACALCRFMRSFAFGGMGAAAGGYGALALGAGQNDAILAACVGAVALVVIFTGKKQ